MKIQQAKSFHNAFGFKAKGLFFVLIFSAVVSAVYRINTQPAYAAPTVSITSPADGTTINTSTSLTITASATDSSSSIAKVEFYISGLLWCTDITAPYSCAVSTGPYISNRTLIVTAKAYNLAGTTAISTPVSFTIIDVTRPTVSVWDVQPRPTTTDGLVTATFTVTDISGSHLKSVQLMRAPFNSTSCNLSLGSLATHCNWNALTTVTAPSGLDSWTGSITDNLSTQIQGSSWMYGLTVLNNNGRSIYEPYNFQVTYGTPPPLAISNVLVTPDVTNSSVTITWTTNYPAISSILLSGNGVCPAGGCNIAGPTVYSTIHNFTVGGLSLSTTYYYQALSTAQNGGRNTYSGTFVVGLLDTTLPTISSWDVGPRPTTLIPVTVFFTVADTGGSHLSSVSLYRAPYDATNCTAVNAAGCRFIGVQTATAPAGLDAWTGSMTDDLSSFPLDSTFVYKISVFDVASQGGSTASSNYFQTTYGTTPPADSTAPVISRVSAIVVSATKANILWSTEGIADSQVQFIGSCPSSLNASACSTALDTTPTKDHLVFITGLAPQTTYTYVVKSKNAGGSFASDQNTFITPAFITNVQVTNLTDLTATITWNTSDLSTSQIEFPNGPCPGSIFKYFDTSPCIEIDSTLTLNHSVALTRLIPSTTYTFVVKSAKDIYSTTVPYTSDQGTFTTLPSGALIDDLLNEPDSKIMMQKAKDSGFVVENHVYDAGESTIIKNTNGKVVLSEVIQFSFNVPLPWRRPDNLAGTCQANPGARVLVVDGDVPRIKALRPKTKIITSPGISEDQSSTLRALTRDAIDTLNKDLDDYQSAGKGDTSRIPRFQKVYYDSPDFSNPSDIDINLSYGGNGGGASAVRKTPDGKIHGAIGYSVATTGFGSLYGDRVTLMMHELAHQLGLGHVPFPRSGERPDLMQRAPYLGEFAHISDNQIKALIDLNDPSRVFPLSNCFAGEDKTLGFSQGPIDLSSYVKTHYAVMSAWNFGGTIPLPGGVCANPLPTLAYPQGLPGTPGYVFEALAVDLHNIDAWIDGCSAAFLLYKDEGDAPFGTYSVLVKNLAGSYIMPAGSFDFWKGKGYSVVELTPGLVLDSTPPAPVRLPIGFEDYYNQHPEALPKAPNNVVNSVPTDAFYPPPSVKNTSISSSNVTADGTTPYTISVGASDDSGVGNIDTVRATINRQGGNAGNNMGYFFWTKDAPDAADAIKTVVCSGGGYGWVDARTSYYLLNDVKYPLYDLSACSVADSGSSKTANFLVKFDPSINSSGTNTISADAYNGMGSLGYQSNFTANTFKLVPDTTAPAVSIIYPPDPTTLTMAQTVRITATATDNVGVTKVEFYDGVQLVSAITQVYPTYYYDWAFDTSANGTHTWTAKAYDAAGNIGTSSAVNLIVNVPYKPHISLNPTSLSFSAVIGQTPPAQIVSITNTVSSSTLNWTASSNQAWCPAFSPFSGTGAASLSIFANSLTTAGIFNCTLTFSDPNADNTPQVVAITYVVSPDTTPPVVTITAPANNSTYTSAQSIPISYSYSDNAGVSAMTKLDRYIDGNWVGGLSGYISTSDTYTWSITTANNGTHTFTVKVYDVSGNIGTASINIIINIPIPDTTPPTTSVTAPAFSSTISGTAVTVSANASDNVGVLGVQFKLDGVNLSSEDTTSPYSVSWDTMTSTNASHTLTAIARDAAGNKTTSSSVTIIVDNSLPTVSITSPANNARIGGKSSISISSSARDNRWVKKVEIYVDNILKNTCTSSSTTNTSLKCSYTWSLSGVSSGSHTIQAKAYDANNQQASSLITVTK